MAKYTTLNALFTAIANSLRNKTNSSGKIVADDFPSVIDSLSTGGITPTGTKTITANGEHDVTNFASAIVNVSTPEQNYYVFPITLSADVGAGTAKNQVILSGNTFVKQHYADEGFFAMWLPLSATTAAASGVAGMVYNGNRALLTTKYTYYGYFLRSAGETANANSTASATKISDAGYNVSLRANSSGNINLYVAANYTVPAGNYLLVLGLAE